MLKITSAKLDAKIVAAKVTEDGLSIPMVAVPVQGMEEALKQAVLMYAAGADRVTLFADIVLSEEDKAALRQHVKDSGLSPNQEDDEETTGSSKVVDLSKVRALGNA